MPLDVQCGPDPTLCPCYVGCMAQQAVLWGGLEGRRDRILKQLLGVLAPGAEDRSLWPWYWEQVENSGRIPLPCTNHAWKGRSAQCGQTITSMGLGDLCFSLCLCALTLNDWFGSFGLQHPHLRNQEVGVSDLQVCFQLCNPMYVKHLGFQDSPGQRQPHGCG